MLERDAGRDSPARAILIAPEGDRARLAAEIEGSARVPVEVVADRAALERACDRPIAVIVIEEGLPGLDLAAAQAVWRTRGQSPEVIVVAASWDEAAMRAAAAIGAADFVTLDQLPRLGAAVAREARRVERRIDQAPDARARREAG